MNIHPTYALAGFTRYELANGALFLRQSPSPKWSPVFLGDDAGAENYFCSIPKITPRNTQCVLVQRESKNCYRYALQDGKQILFGSATSLQALTKRLTEIFPS